MEDFHSRMLRLVVELYETGNGAGSFLHRTRIIYRMQDILEEGETDGADMETYRHIVDGQSYLIRRQSAHLQACGFYSMS